MFMSKKLHPTGGSTGPFALPSGITARLRNSEGGFHLISGTGKAKRPPLFNAPFGALG